jgi:hypothetical protein
MEYNLKNLVASMWKHRENKDFERKSLMTSYRGLSVKASIGMTGVISKIPWISYCAAGQETQKGIYPVLLFYGTPEFQQKNKNNTEVKKIVLAYGVSATKQPDIIWGAVVDDKKTIEDVFKEWNYETSDAGIKKYNSSYVYKVYDWNEDVNYDIIQKDVDQLIDKYLGILSSSKSSKTNSKQDNTDLGNDPEKSVKKEISILDFSNLQPSQIIYYGAPGTGKSYTVKKKEKEGLRCIRTTFHPDCDYATFIGCYKPHCNRGTGKIIYEFVEQAFLTAYLQAWKNPQQEVALVIEEINRGNCAQIFGDIFQLLDRDDDGWSTYPIKADTDISDYLENLAINGYGEMMAKRYGKDKAGYSYLALPPNMSILATMNTSDQSLFPIDSAFKRRWEWKYIKIKEGRDENGNKLDWKVDVKMDEAGNLLSWWAFIQKINEIIASMTSSVDKQLGYFFCCAKDGVIDEDTFVSKVIFYLWNDVFKDYGFEDASLFRYTDNEGKEKDLTFPDFYDENGEKVNTERLTDFVKKVMNWKKTSEENN